MGDDILQSLEPHGFVGLAFFESGARSVYTIRRPLRTIDDIKGLRIRLQQSEFMVEMFAALGAEPVILPYTRTKTALTTGLVDAAENNWPSYIASNHYSVAPFFTLTEHTMTPDILIMSMKAWGALIRRIRISFEVRHETQAYICAVNGKIGRRPSASKHWT
jgi:TRAP-type C4-dicarboxylate transport system substrate-binding protein